MHVQTTILVSFLSPTNNRPARYRVSSPVSSWDDRITVPVNHKLSEYNQVKDAAEQWISKVMVPLGYSSEVKAIGALDQSSYAVLIG